MPPPSCLRGGSRASHIQIEDAIWIKVAVRQRVQRGHIAGGHLFAPGSLAENLLDHKGIHVDHRRLQQM